MWHKIKSFAHCGSLVEPVAQNNIDLPIAVKPIVAQNNIDLPIVVEPIEAQVADYLFDSHARDSSGMPDLNGTADVIKFTNITS